MKTTTTLHSQSQSANLFTWCANMKEGFHGDAGEGLGPISDTVSNIFALWGKFLE